MRHPPSAIRHPPSAQRESPAKRGIHPPDERIRHLPGPRPRAPRAGCALALPEAARAFPILGGAWDVPPTVPLEGSPMRTSQIFLRSGLTVAAVAALPLTLTAPTAAAFGSGI